MRIQPAAIAAFVVCVAAPALPAERTSLPSAVRLVRVPHSGIQPQAAVDDKGTIHLVYFAGEARQGDLFYVRSTDAGATFSPPVRVNSQAGSAIAAGTIRGGQIALGKNGRVHVAWHGKATSGSAKGESGRQVWIARSTDEGKSFAGETPAWAETTGACGCCGLGIFSSKAGSVYALYRSATEETHRDIYVLASENKGTTFDGHLLHKWEINACPMSSMAFAESDGTVLGAWETGGQVYFSVLHTKTGSPEPTPAPGAGKGRKHPRLAANGRETILIWTEGTGWQRGGSLAWRVFDKSGKPVSAAGQTTGVPAWSFGAVVADGPNGFLIFY